MLPVAAAAIALAAPANADDNSNFLMDIKNAGINFSDSSTTVTAGRTACRMLEAGSSEDEVISGVQSQNPGVSRDKAQTFEQTAVSDLCPDNAPGEPADVDTAGSPAAGLGQTPGSGSASGQTPGSGSASGQTPGVSSGPPGSSTGTGPPNGTTTH